MKMWWRWSIIPRSLSPYTEARAVVEGRLYGLWMKVSKIFLKGIICWANGLSSEIDWNNMEGSSCRVSGTRYTPETFPRVSRLSLSCRPTAVFPPAPADQPPVENERTWPFAVGSWDPREIILSGIWTNCTLGSVAFSISQLMQAFLITEDYCSNISALWNITFKINSRYRSEVSKQCTDTTIHRCPAIVTINNVKLDSGAASHGIRELKHAHRFERVDGAHTLWLCHLFARGTTRDQIGALVST